MLYDGLTLAEGTTAANLAISSGTSNPTSPTTGELFYRTDSPNTGLYVYNGTTWEPVGGTAPYDIAFTVADKPIADATVLYIPLPRACSIPTDATLSRASAGTAGTTSTSTFSLRKNGTQFGTFSFAASATTATFTVTATSFVAGDVLSVTAPNPQNSTLANIGVTLVMTV